MNEGVLMASIGLVRITAEAIPPRKIRECASVKQMIKGQMIFTTLQISSCLVQKLRKKNSHVTC